MAITQLSATRFGGEVLVSQPWKWLMQRFAAAPQVRLVFDEESPQSPDHEKNFVEQ